MSKLYKKYLNLKKENDKILYLFESGKFYIFLDEDAKLISSITTLKLTNLSKDVLKCGFPSISYEKYMTIFNNLGLNIKVINNDEENCSLDKLVQKIKRIDIDNITPMESLYILKELKEYINE